MSKINLHEIFKVKMKLAAEKQAFTKGNAHTLRTEPAWHYSLIDTEAGYTAALNDLQGKVDGLTTAFSKLIKTVPYNSIEPDYLIEAKQALAEFKNGVMNDNSR